MFLEQQISILQLLLKDHVALKTGVISSENSSLPSQEYISFVYIYYNRKVYFKLLKIFHLSICLSVCLSVCLSFCLSVLVVSSITIIQILPY